MRIGNLIFSPRISTRNITGSVPALRDPPALEYTAPMCWYCGAPILDQEPLGRSLRCPDCGKDLRSCRNCQRFLPGGRADCAESQAESVADKELGNFCGWFSLNPRFRAPTAGEKKAQNAAVSAKAAFEGLFS